MKDQNRSNKKFLWAILLTVVAILLCYMFVVLYFFYISPNNISVKLTLWPFLSDESISEMYLDSTMEIRFSSNDLNGTQNSVVGVNVREDGFVLAPYHKFKSISEDSEIKIYANSGTVFDGELIFAEENFDLAVLKCKNHENEKSAIKVPYVQILASNPKENCEVVSIASPLGAQHIWKGDIESYKADAMLTVFVENSVAVDFVIENSSVMSVENASEFMDGAVFDLYGNLLGFSYAEARDVKGNFVVSSAKNAKLFLKDVVKAYAANQKFENSFANELVGLDSTELSKHFELSGEEKGRPDHFFLKNSWRDSKMEGLSLFYSADSSGFFLVEDFVHGDATIGASNIITSVKIGDLSTKINEKNDLFEIAYKIKKGQSIQIEFMSVSDSQSKTINFVV